MNNKLTFLAAACALLSGAQAFVPAGNAVSRSNTELSFGFPSFEPKKDDGENKEDKKIDAKGVLQLITAGMGAPFLGDFEGVDEESGKFMFSLEANNLVDADGNSKQTSAPYFESGWVDPEDEKRAAEGFKFPWQK